LKSVIVIGGGLAGLAAGVALAESGWRVRLFEQRPFLGGRATSYVLPDGEHVDNCQHVTLGCLPTSKTSIGAWAPLPKSSSSIGSSFSTH